MHPNRVSGDLSTQHPAPARSPSPGPNPVSISPALSPPGVSNWCAGSRQRWWVPFQEGSGRSRHPRGCLSFPLGRVRLPRTSLPDPRRWLPRHAGTCCHAGRGPHRVRARPLRCLTQAGPCLPFPLPAASKAARIAQPLGANRSHRLLCPGRGGDQEVPKPLPFHPAPCAEVLHPPHGTRGPAGTLGYRGSAPGTHQSFLGCCQGDEGPPASPHSPTPRFAKGIFQHSSRFSGELDGGGVRLRPGTLHYTSQRNTSTLSLFLQAPAVCSAWGCVSTSTERGETEAGQAGAHRAM